MMWRTGVSSGGLCKDCGRPIWAAKLVMVAPDGETSGDADPENHQRRAHQERLMT